MKIVNCGYNYRHSLDFKINRPRGSGDFVLLVLRSPSFFSFGGGVSLTDGNSIVVYRKGTPQIYGAYNEEYVNDWVHFEAEAGEEEVFERLGIPFDRILEVNNVSEISSLVKNICFEKYSGNKNATESALLYFNLILLKISDLCHMNVAKNKAFLAEQLAKLRQEIYSEPQKDWRVGDIAERLLISRSYLQHQYKLLFDCGIKRDVTSSRIEYGKYLLFSTDLPVGEISRLCGYENEVHFMRTFKRESGMTPSEYRLNANFSREKAEESKRHNPFPL